MWQSQHAPLPDTVLPLTPTEPWGPLVEWRSTWDWDQMPFISSVDWATKIWSRNPLLSIVGLQFIRVAQCEYLENPPFFQWLFSIKSWLPCLVWGKEVKTTPLSKKKKKQKKGERKKEKARKKKRVNNYYFNQDSDPDPFQNLMGTSIA